MFLNSRVRKTLRTHVGDLDVGAVPCGLGRAIGNKVYTTDLSSHISDMMHEVEIKYNYIYKTNYIKLTIDILASQISSR